MTPPLTDAHMDRIGHSLEASLSLKEDVGAAEPRSVQPTDCVVASSSPSKEEMPSRPSHDVPPPPPPPPPPARYSLVCDAHYGFPTQRRPRRERINAVARQLRNFEVWVQGRRRDRSPIVSAAVVGAEGDVAAIRERLVELRGGGSLRGGRRWRPAGRRKIGNKRRRERRLYRDPIPPGG